jgi:hypothetical protein
VIDVGQTKNGTGRTFHVNAATIAATASSIGIVIFLGGFITGYLVMRQNLDDMRTSVAAIKSSLESLQSRLTHVEDDTHYAAQGIADLKALTAGTHR